MPPPFKDALRPRSCAILTLALRLVQRTVGRVEQRFVRSSVDTGQRSAHAERDERAAFASLPVHPQSSPLRLNEIGVRQIRDELVAADTRNDGVVRRQRLFKRPRHVRQQLVAGQMAERIVHAFEVVDVDDEQSAHAAFSHRCATAGR